MLQEKPIVQGGMGWVGAELPAAVSNAGCCGMVTAGSHAQAGGLAGLRELVRECQSLTDKPFGVNFLLLNSAEDYNATAQVVIEEGVKVVETAGRPPPPELLQRLHDAGVAVIHKVTTVRHALAAEKALAAVIQEAYVQGVSTRNVDDLVKALGMSGVSKSQVSRLCVEIDERVEAFLERPLEGEWPYVWLDATYVKVRRSGRIVSVAAIVAVAVNLDGRREVLGIAIQPSEAEVFWDEFLRTLADRGLRGVKLIIADEHKGLKGAAAKVLGATIQRCRVHFMRNALACVGKKDRPIVTAALRTAFDQDTLADSKEHWAKLIEAFQPRHPKLAELMLRAEDDVLAYKTFPQAHWRQIHSTNPLERLNKEIKRRTNVVGIFPNEPAIRRLVGALMLEQNDEWAVTRRYMTLETVAAICEDNIMDPAKIAAL